MFIQPFFIPGLAHISYLLGGSKTCAIIDPQREIQLYLDTAKALGMTITHILQTHLHADFVSGHMDLAEKTGAHIYAPKSGNCTFNHVPVKENDTISLEDMTIRVIETPGHTPEHCCYIIIDTSRGTDPVSLFSGDTLFVGDVGRPDLFPSIATQLASDLFDSIHKKILPLPDFCEVYPAHGAGSLCGRAMGAKRSSTIGYERKYNTACLIHDKIEFIKSLTTNMPAAPDHFSRCSDINRHGPQTLSSLSPIKELTPLQIYSALKNDSTIVLDTRSYEAFSGMHIPGSYHIDFSGNFATFAGWILPTDKDMYLVTDRPDTIAGIVQSLHRVGLDRVSGFLDGSLFAWAKAGLPTNHIPLLSTDEIYELSKGKKSLTIIDVRATREFGSSHIEGAINIPAPDLRFRYKELDPSISTALICSTGHRSSLAASILLQHGFKNISNVAGGMTGFGEKGYAPLCAMCVSPHTPQNFSIK